MEPENQPNQVHANQELQSPTNHVHPKWSYIVLGLFGLLTLGIVGTIVLLPNTQQTVQPIVAKNSPTPTQNSTTDTSNWKTYTYKNISFKYPPGWSTEDLTDSLKASTPDLEKDVRFIYELAKNGPRTFDFILRKTTVDQIVSNELKNSTKTYPLGDSGTKQTVKTTVTTSKEKINNIEVATADITSITYADQPVTTNLFIILFPQGNNTIEISGDASDKTFLKQILSTFTFTYQNLITDASTWKTYSNSVYDFRYPAGNNWKLSEQNGSLGTLVSVLCSTCSNQVDYFQVVPVTTKSIDEYIKNPIGTSDFTNFKLDGIDAVKAAYWCTASGWLKYQSIFRL